METDMDPTRLSKRTRDALETLPAEKKSRAREIIARTQTPEALAKDAADRALLDREYRESGQIALLGDKVDPEDAASFRRLIDALRRERPARGLSLDDLARRSELDKAALSRLESGNHANPTVATLIRYARGLGKRLSFSLDPWADTPDQEKPRCDEIPGGSGAADPGRTSSER
jgi:ribosome-binding protein aMBF1 (putative translation factor)